jgi:hypothetical protein
VIPARFQDAYYYSEGLAAVRYYGKWGFIDHAGEWVISPRYTDAKPFREGLACVMIGGKWGFINHAADWLIEPQLKAISSFSDGLALIGNEDGYIFIDRAGNQVIQTVFEQALPFAEGLAFVVHEGYKGYINKKGHWMIKHNYDEAYSFSDGLALVKKDGRYGFIDFDGRLLIDCRFEDANYFREGLAAVKIGMYWGYIDKTGQTSIRPQYELGHTFSQGYAVAKSEGRFGLIDRQGAWAIRPKFSGLARHTMARSIEEQVTEHVRGMFEAWQLKGEFEKTDQYLDRISEENMQGHIDSLTQLAIRHFAIKNIDLKNTQLGLYDADTERFNLIIPGARSIMLPIPIEMAREVKENWVDVWLGNASYSISEDNFVITKLEAKYRGMDFSYDASKDYYIAGSPLPQIDFGDITVQLPVVPTIHSVPIQRPPLTMIGKSDVDKSIPVNQIKNEKTFALIIGNEDYRSYQLDLETESNVDFAEIDARTFREYMVKTIGLPEDNVSLLINATAGQMRRAIAKMSAIAKAYDGEAKLIFYYAGHGLPHPETDEPYLIPVDVNGSNLDYAIRLEDLYTKLTEHSSERVTVFLDACFSGGARNQGLVVARGVRIKPKSPFVLGNLVVFSAASNEQSAYPYREKAHGMFTYYILKGLQISNGQIKYGELAEFVESYVKRKSVLVNEKEQEPEISVSPKFKEAWKSFAFFGEEDLPALTQY